MSGTHEIGIRLRLEGQQQVGAGVDGTKAKFDGLGKSVDGVGAATTGAQGKLRDFTGDLGRTGAAAEQAAPAIERVTDAAGRSTRVLQLQGLTAGQTAQAMRMLPMQITDVVTSLAGGMPVWMVAIQQGGQLRDSFGGVGNTLRAVASLVSPMTAGIAVGAAAVGGLALAYYQGSKEADNFRRELLMSGNAVGLTVGQLTEMAMAVDQVTGTQAAASAALAQLAGTGRVGAENLQEFAQMALQVEDTIGRSVAETVKDLAELGKSPVEASVKLNESLRHLTPAVYDAIKALEEQGRTEEAAALAQRTYAGAMAQRATEIEANLGLLERGWKSVKDAAAEAWDAMLSVGRPKTPEMELAEMEERLASLEKAGRKWARNASGAWVSVAELQDQAAAKRAEIARSQLRAAEQGIAAAATAEYIKAREAVAKWSEAALTDQQKLNKALKEYRDNVETIRNNGGAVSADQVAREEAAIRESFSKKEASAAKKAADEYERLIARLNERVAVGKLEEQQGTKLTENQKVALDLMEQIRSGSLKLTDAQKRQVATTLEEILANEQLAKERKIEAEAMEAVSRFSVKALAEQYQRIDALQLELQGQLQRNEAIGMEGSALAELEYQRAQANIQLLEERLNKERLAGPNAEWLLRLEQEIELQHRLAEARRAGAAKGAAQDALEALGLGKKEIAAKLDLSSVKKAVSGMNSPMAALIDSFQTLVDLQAEFGKQAEHIAEAKKGDAAQQAKALKAESELAAKSAQAQISGYANMAGAAKGFFSTGSRGYQALHAAEKAFRVFELAMALKNAATQAGLITGITSAKLTGDAAQAQSATMSAGVQVAAALKVGQANAAAGTANQANGDPYTAFPRMAAMAALMAGLGFATGAFGSKGDTSAMTAARMQEKQGTGTVLGDAAAKSESITRALEALQDIDTLTMRYSAQMAASLRNIESSMSGLAGIVVRTYGMTSGNPFGVTEGQIGGSGFIGKLLGSTLGKLWGSTKQELIDSGIEIARLTVGELAAGQGFRQYGTVQTTKKSWFGLKKSSSTSSVYADIPDEISTQFGLVFQELGASLSSAAGALGLSTGTIASQIDAFTLDLQKISLRGMSGEQVQEALTNVFSAAFDRVAGAVLPGLDDFQKVGEGYYETVIRVATGVEQAQVALEQLGVMSVTLQQIVNRQGDVGAELVRESLRQAEGLSGIAELIRLFDGSAAEIAELYSGLTQLRNVMRALGIAAADVTSDMVRGAGNLEALQGGLASYRKSYFSESEQLSADIALLQREFARLGVAMPESKEAFREMVESLDLTTEAGQRTFGALMQLAPGFAEVTDAATEYTRQQVAMATEIRDAFADAIESIRNLRASIAGDIGRILGTNTLRSPDLILRDLAGINTTLPDSSALQRASSAYNASVSGLNSATQWRDSSAATLAARQSTLSAAQVTAAQKNAALDSALAAERAASMATYNWLISETSRAPYWDEAKFRAAWAEPTQTINKSYVDANGNVRWGSSSTQYYDVSKPVHTWNWWKDGGWFGSDKSGEFWTNANQGLVDQFFSALSKRWTAEDEHYAALWKQQDALAAVTSQTRVLTNAENQLAQATAAEAAAKEALLAAQADYQAALTEFALDAKIGVERLSKLREETLAWYEAQKALSTAMTGAAAKLRATVRDVLAATSPETKLASLQAQFDAAFASALVSSGSALASKSEELNALIGPLLEAAKGYYATSGGYQDIQAYVLESAQKLAARLEAEAPQGYEEASLAALQQIDVALEALGEAALTAERMIVNAINASKDSTLLGLRGVVAAILGNPVPAFAAGGMHLGGLRLVGERGPELEATGPARIWSAEQTRRLLSGGGSGTSDAALQESRRQSDELARQTRELQALVRQNGEGTRAMLQELAEIKRRLAAIESDNRLAGIPA